MLYVIFFAAAPFIQDNLEALQVIDQQIQNDEQAIEDFQAKNASYSE